MRGVIDRTSRQQTWGKILLLYTAGFVVFVVIGIFARTARKSEYYVPSRTVPTLFNGMATASDWMSAASFIGLAGTIFVCSLLGGMKAVTWTQAAQYVILIIAYLIPPVVLSQKVTGVPIPQFMYGRVLQKIDAAEKAINLDPKEAAVRDLWKTEADRLGADLKALPGGRPCRDPGGNLRVARRCRDGERDMDRGAHHRGRSAVDDLEHVVARPV